MRSLTPVGVCVLPEKGINVARTVSYPNYIYEILDHAGVFHTKLAVDEIEAWLSDIGVLVTIGDADVPDGITDWVKGGGAWISIAGTCGRDDLLGATRREPEMWSWAGGVRSLGEGYLVPLEKDHPAIAHVTRPTHLFNGATVTAKGAKVLARVDDKHGRPTDRPALLENIVGKGRTMLLAPDLTGTIVRIQQGVGVTRDGVAASDGSAPINDHVLKSDDGAVLDWDFDRDPVPGVPNFRAYLEPAADVSREIFLRCIFHLAREQNVPVPVLWLYPRRLTAIAQMSHDSDGNEPERCDRLLELLDEADVKTTWCVILPGYDAGRIAKIKSAGHELAIHFDGISDGCHWSEEDYARQCRELTKMFGEVPINNKNHMARWEGDCEFWQWCVKLGIEIDQSKAASKTGECGYNFGTCHPYFPVTFRGETIDCLELCTPVWDLHAFAPVEIFDALLASVKKHHGILHQLFHPYHTIRPEIGESLVASIRKAREAGLEWWTARQINSWERARRGVRLESFSHDTIILSASERLPDATILFLDAPSSVADAFNAWGFTFSAAVKTIEAHQATTMNFG